MKIMCFSRAISTRGFVRRWFARIALALLSTLVGLLLAEQFVRLFAPQPLVRMRGSIWIPVDGLGHQKTPHLDTIIDTGEGPVRLLTDERGHRVGPEGPPAGRRRILAVRDSFLEGLQVDYRDLVTTRLAGMLERQESLRKSAENAVPTYAVVNTGVSGWDLNRYYRKARQELSADDLRAGAPVLLHRQ